MTIDAIAAASDEGAFASPALGRQAWLRLIASQEARYTREREEEAEAYWEQASSVCSVDPIG